MGNEMAGMVNLEALNVAASVSERIYGPPRVLAWQPASSIWHKLHRASAQLFGRRDYSYSQAVMRAIDQHGIDCILAYWGTNCIADVITAKRLRPNTKVLLNVLCHPTALSLTKISVQNWLFRRSAGYFDGYIVSSHAMKEYLQKHVLRNRDVDMLIWPPYLSQHYHPSSRLTAAGNMPNVLFLGRMDWRKGQPTDCVSSYMHQLMEHGVHVYHHRSPESPSDHPCGHTFEYRELAKAIEYATQFDVSLILYDLSACKRTDRFEVTVPDRLVASVAAGVPVAIPSHGYSACKEYLRDYRAIIEFDSIPHLAEQLRNRTRIRALQRLVQEHSANYLGEAHIGRLLSFIKAVAQRNTGSPNLQSVL
jgi:glycosyltransferase involved in cell wall biosynthesis